MMLWLRYLILLCYHPTNMPNSHANLSAVNLSQASVSRALQVLLDNDLVVQVDGEYQVIDPTFKWYFKLF